MERSVALLVLEPFDISFIKYRHNGVALTVPLFLARNLINCRLLYQFNYVYRSHLYDTRSLFDFQVNFELRKLADSKGPDENRFNQLANSVEEFTTSFLDPLRSDQRWREEFGDGLDEILEDAIQLEQKKV